MIFVLAEEELNIFLSAFCLSCPSRETDPSQHPLGFHENNWMPMELVNLSYSNLGSHFCSGNTSLYCYELLHTQADRPIIII